MARLLVIHTGGTLMMSESGGAGEGALRPDAYGRDLVIELPSLRRIAQRSRSLPP